MSWAACGEAKVEEKRRRELLTPPSKAALQAAKKAKSAVFDDKGELLPSELVLGGFAVPRGFELLKSYEHEWALYSRVASAEVTLRYVQQRLFTGSLIRSAVGGAVFEAAQLRHDTKLPRVTVRVSPTKGEKRACELNIRRIPVVPKEDRLTTEQIEAQLREKARFPQ